MTNMPIQPLWLTHFIEILLVLQFQLTINYFGMFSYKAHFRPQIPSNEWTLKETLITGFCCSDYTPMFISGCVYNVIESFHALMFRSGVSIM